MKKTAGKGIPGIIVACLFGMSSSVFSQNPVVNRDPAQKGTWNFNPALVWSVSEAGEDILPPNGFTAVAENGRIFYYDDQSSCVHAFDPAGKHLFSFGRKGEGPGEFKFAWDMKATADTLAVNDTQRYQIFDQNGKFRNTVQSPGEGEGVVSETLLLYSLEEENSQSLFLYNVQDQSKVLLKKMSAPARLMAEGGGLRLRVRDANMVTGIYTASRSGRIVFGQSEQYKLFIADSDGKIVSSFEIQNRNRPTIPEAYKLGRYSRLKVNGAPVTKSMLEQLIRGIPDQGPYFNKIKILRDSGILVMLPEYENRQRREFDLFSAEGTYLYRCVLDMPDGMEFNENAWDIQGDSLVMFTEGPDDEGSLKKFKIRLPPLQ